MLSHRSVSTFPDGGQIVHPGAETGTTHLHGNCA